MGKPTGNKPAEIKYKVATGVSVNVMPLTTYQIVHTSEFNEQGKPIGG